MSGRSSEAAFWLSPVQAAIWSGQSGASPWNSVTAISMKGPIAEDAMHEALRRVMQQNEIWRTVFLIQSAIKQPFQQILDNGELLFESADLSTLSADERWTEVERGFVEGSRDRFDLQQGPLVKARYYVLEAEQAALVLSLPALLSDAGGIEAMTSKLAAAYGRYEGFPQESLRYVQFSQWQADTLESNDENAAAAKTYWTDPARNAVSPPLLEERQSLGSFHTGIVSVSTQIDFDNLNAAPETVLHAAWQTLLWRLTGETRFVTRLFLDGREYEELKPLLGPVGKFVPVSARFDGDFSFRDVVQRLERAQFDGAQWQEYLQPGSGSEDGLAFDFEYMRQVSIDKDGVTFTVVRHSVLNERFRLKLCAFDRMDQSGDANVHLDLRYDANRVSDDTARRWLGHFVNLLAAASKEPDTPVSRLPLLTADERNRILFSWNATQTDYPREVCFHHLFEQQVERTPELPAIRASGQQLSYRELNDYANRLASFLQSTGLGRGARVGLILDRSVHALTGLLAVLKSGAAYVPLNPDNPKVRLSAQLQMVDTLLTESKLIAALPEFRGRIIVLDEEADRWANAPLANPAASLSSEDVCYVIFTSGSTGDPKAVAVRHRNLVNYATFIAHRLQLFDRTRQLQFASVSTLSADLGNTCIFPALLSGGCVHLVGHDDAADPGALAEYCRNYPIDVLKIVPSHLSTLLDSAEAACLLPREVLITGGEALTSSVVDHLAMLKPSCAVLNHYGPTETTIGSLTFPVDLEQSSNAPVPAGRPIANTRAYILDASLEPVPAGVRGELYIGGDGVSAGYLNDAALTAHRFVGDPFAGGKMYRTGDHAWYRPDGNIVFLGRRDNQIKIRGFRVELGEIENALLKYPSVKQAVAIAKDASSSQASVVAYVVPPYDRRPTPGELREYLKSELPSYMVPSAIGILPKLPLTANGKLDRDSLPDPVEAAQRSRIPPRNATEEGVLAVWEEVFRRDDLGVQDDFFDLGGHSLMATQIVSRLRERFQVVLEMRALFQFPTVEGIAGAVLSAPVANQAEIVPVRRALYRRQ